MSRITEVLRRARAQAAGEAAVTPVVEGDFQPDALGPWTLDDVPGSDAPPPDDAKAADAFDARPRKALPRRHGSVKVLPIRGARQLPDREILQYADVLRRRWRTGVAIFVIVVLGVGTGAFFEEPVYRATGLLEIRPETTGTGPVETLFSSARVTSDELETQFGILKSATLAQRVIAKLDREDAATAKSRKGKGRSRASEPAQASGGPLTWQGLQDGLRVNPQKGSRLVEVSFDASTPTMAARVVNSVFDEYLQQRMEDAKHSAGWLQQQLDRAQHRLEESERQLEAYIRAHGVQVLETGKGETADAINQRLEALHEALTTAQTERMEKQSAAEQALLQTSAHNLDSPVVQSLTVRLTELQREHAKLTSTFHDDYPAVQAVNSQLVELQRALDKEKALVVNRLQREYRAALRRESLLRGELARQSAMVEDLGKESATNIGYAALKRELVTNQAQFTALNQKLKEVSISTALKAANVGIVDRAAPPDVPNATAFDVTVALAVVVGLILGVGAMLLREHLDTSMRSREDIDLYLGVPTLAAIPAVGNAWRALPLRAIDSSPTPGAEVDQIGRESPLAEAFAVLRTAVLLHPNSEVRALLVTSAQSAEGKTTVSINLALSLARLGQRVLLVDANMRLPGVQTALGLTHAPGLVAYLTGAADWRNCVHTRPLPNLDVLAGGIPAMSPADLLSLPRMRQLVTAASMEYDFVVIDSPALLAHPSDVQCLATMADSVLLTVRQGVTPRAAVTLALAQLPRVSGVVLNHSKCSSAVRPPSDLAVGTA